MLAVFLPLLYYDTYLYEKEVYMLEADCGCVFRTLRSIPPERPCPEGTQLLNKLTQDGYWGTDRYMKHMKKAWNTLPVYPSSVQIGDHIFKTEVIDG